MLIKIWLGYSDSDLMIASSTLLSQYECSFHRVKYFDVWFWKIIKIGWCIWNKIWVLILNFSIQTWQFDTSSTWNPFIARRHKWWWQDSFHQSTWPLKIATISWLKSRVTFTWSIPNSSGRFREAMSRSEKEYFLSENSQGWINNCTECSTSVSLNPNNTWNLF